MRIGMGFDVHRLVEGREMWLCGVKLGHEKGLLGHSDADVAIHALCDALLGAACLRDIGYHFPDTDERYKGIDSCKLLEQVMVLLRDRGYELGNCDITICAERPKINPHIPAMQRRLALCIRCQLRPPPPRNWGSPAARKALPPTQWLCSKNNSFHYEQGKVTGTHSLP